MIGRALKRSMSRRARLSPSRRKSQRVPSMTRWSEASPREMMAGTTISLLTRAVIDARVFGCAQAAWPCGMRTLMIESLRVGNWLMLFKTMSCGYGQKGASLVGDQSFCGFRLDFQTLSTKLSTAFVGSCKETMTRKCLAHDNAGVIQVARLIPCFHFYVPSGLAHRSVRRRDDTERSAHPQQRCIGVLSEMP